MLKQSLGVMLTVAIATQGIVHADEPPPRVDVVRVEHAELVRQIQAVQFQPPPGGHPSLTAVLLVTTAVLGALVVILLRGLGGP